VAAAIVKKMLQLNDSLHTFPPMSPIPDFEKTKLSRALQLDLANGEMPLDAHWLNKFTF
jgi:hypothetical protein